MKLSASKEGHNRVFQAKLGWKEQFDPKEIEMLSAGTVPMLIPPATVLGRKNNIIEYDISPYSTLEFYLTCILSREQFAQMMLQCVELFQRMQQVYLNYKNLVLEPDQIYVLLADHSLHFIYLPLMGGRREASIPDFFRMLIKRMKAGTFEQANFLQQCMAWLNRPAPFVLNEFQHYILTGEAAAQQPVSAQECPPQYAPPITQSDHSVTYHPVSPAKPPEVQFQSGETTLLECGGGAPTVLLVDSEQAPAPKFTLQWERNGEQITLDRFPFVVGTEIGSVDYCIAQNPAVSRRHAVFSVQNGQCTVTDQGSTNRTYVNGYALEPQTEYLLQDGDCIKLANEQFTFTQEG